MMHGVCGNPFEGGFQAPAHGAARDNPWQSATRLGFVFLFVCHLVCMRFAWTLHVVCNAYRGRGRISGGDKFMESFVFIEGGEIFPWRDLGALGVQWVREAVCFGICKGGEILPFPRRNDPCTKLSPSPGTFGTCLLRFVVFFRSTPSSTCGTCCWSRGSSLARPCRS